jgi:hypothetical protein
LGKKEAFTQQSPQDVMGENEAPNYFCTNIISVTREIWSPITELDPNNKGLQR